jgi:hypothetical protein
LCTSFNREEVVGVFVRFSCAASPDRLLDLLQNPGADCHRDLGRSMAQLQMFTKPFRRSRTTKDGSAVIAES